MDYRGHRSRKSRKYPPPIIRDEQHELSGSDSDSDDNRSGKHHRHTDSESSSSGDEKSRSETDSDADVKSKPASELVKDHQEEHIHEKNLNVSDAETSAKYIKRLERDNFRLTQQVRALQTGIPFDSPVHVKGGLSGFGWVPGGKQKAGGPDIDATQEEEKAVEDSFPSLEILRYKKKQKHYGGFKLVRDLDGSNGKDKTRDLTGKHVLTVKREFDVTKAYWRTCIEILSPNLQRLLDQVPDLTAKWKAVDDVYYLTEPFVDLFHNRKALADSVGNGDDASLDDKDLIQARSHMRLVLSYLRSDFVDLSRKLDDLESNDPPKFITYPEIFLIYKPGTIVYATENGEQEAFVIDSVRGMRKRQRRNSKKSGFGRFDLMCWSINYDGEAFGRVWSMHCIAPFEGNREISSLELIPEKFLPNPEETRQFLHARGQKFWKLQGQQCHEYTGELYSQQKKEEFTRVMIDHLTYQRRNDWPISIDRKRGPSDAMNKNWRDNRFTRDDDSYCGSPRRHRGRSPPPEDTIEEEYNDGHYIRHDNMGKDQYKRYTLTYPPSALVSKFEKYDLLDPTVELDELALLVCPQHVHGYCLRERNWKNLNINQLRPVLYRENAWDRLVLDAEYKSIVRAMVSSYVTKSAPIDDVVAGKGSGLVALLHGPPGSGKTLTAECVAESFHKPLYQVTCGDIGTDPDELEFRLEEIFDYSTTWGAILLLDEADIFLQDRDYTSLERNALVSIFLRTLDYFSGILFLTTNRVGAFDQAFQSRIHVTLGLPVLDQTRRIAVWSIFVDDLAKKNAYSAKEHDRLKSLVRDKWSLERLNGRQIRNAMRTALVVAEQKGVVLGDEEVGVVLRIGREFEGYMKTIGKAQREGVEGFVEVAGP